MLASGPNSSNACGIGPYTGSSTIIQNDPKKLVEYLMSDLRTLSTEAKKRHNHVKEASESGIVKIRNISTSSTSDQLQQNLKAACAEIIHPLILGCSSKNPKLVQISLQSIQRLLQFRVIDANSSPVIVNELWHLTEAECEELRVLQTITPFVSTELLVTDSALAKCIVLAIKLNFSKDPSIINAASAAVRQLFDCVFERVFQEDKMYASETNGNDAIEEENKIPLNQNFAPSSLRLAAADGYLLLKDLTLLIKKENPVWLNGVKRITTTLALELLESILKQYPSIFCKHIEYAKLLQNEICPQLIKLFLGEKVFQTSDEQNNFKSNSEFSTLSRPIFPILMRSLRISLVLLTHYHSLLIMQNEVIIGFLLNLIYSENFLWQTAMALEILHKLVTQPNLLYWLCENYDLKPNVTKLVRLILQSIVSYIKKALEDANDENVLQDYSHSHGQPGFQFKTAFIPYYENLSQKRCILLEWLEKHEPSPVADGYCLSVAYMCLVDCTQSVYAIIEDQNKTESVAKRLFLSTYSHLLDGFSTLLECSIDDSITNNILNSLSTIIIMACHFANHNETEILEAKDLSLQTLCQAVLPSGYFQTFIKNNSMLNLQNLNQNELNTLIKTFSNTHQNKDGNANIPCHIVAMGTICPMPSMPSSMFNTTVMLSSKNIQVSRVLIACANDNGQQLTDCWEMILATLQHLVWILGMRSTSATSFKTGNETPSLTSTNVSNTTNSNNAITGNVILTAVVSSELPELNNNLNKLFESTVNYDEVSLHHVIAALCKLSSEAMMVAQTNFKEPSFFPVSKILQTSFVNLKRLEIFWKPVTAHLLEICSHTNASLRDWGTIALTTLIKSAMKQVLNQGNENLEFKTPLCSTKNKLLILTPLASINEIEFVDVKTRQLDCLMHILQSDSQELMSKIWPLIINIVTSVVDNSNAQLVEQGYQTMSLIVKEFLVILPFDCIQMLLETNTKYGKQQVDLNVSLSAVGQLWDISDYVRRESVNYSNKIEVEHVWLVLYECLSVLCVDSRPPVRKSACDTLLQTIAAHGQALQTSTWSEMIWKIFFPMLDKVKVYTSRASTFPTNTVALGASNIMIHHSRNTEWKQWAETTVKTLGGIVKIFNSHRTILLSIESFSQYWIRLLNYFEAVAAADNGEMSLAALKNFYELLFGRQQQTDSRDRQGLFEDLTIPQFPEKLWMVSWQTWLKIARIISSPYVNVDVNLEAINNDSLSAKPQPNIKLKSYVPGSFHLTTLLNIFILLFNKVSRQILVKELYFENVPTILKNISTIPPSDQLIFADNSENSELNLTQERILDCVRVIFQEQLDAHSKLRLALPDLIQLLLNFVEYTLRPPATDFVSANNENQFQKTKQHLIAFGELSLQTAVDYYLKVANYPEIVENATLVEIIKTISKPLALKYNCPNQTTWKTAATSLIKICQIGLPICRENLTKFTELWPCLADVFEKFLFTTNKSVVQLNADERKRHEFVDCMIIELICKQILPYANILPQDFMQKIINVLNQGSINTMDANDVMGSASDLFQHRADLSRVCFDALLSLTCHNSEKRLSSTFFSSSPSYELTKISSFEKGKTNLSQESSNSLGVTAITSLLSRCKQVLNNYARDEQNSGHFRLPQERIFETICVLRAISILIDEFAKRFEDSHSVLYSNLVGIYPNLIQMIPSCRSDQQLELSLMTALNSYQTLLLINIHKFN